MQRSWYRKRSLYNIEAREAGRILIDGKWLWDFASNDYLGLSHNEIILKQVLEGLRGKTGALGSTASRLLSGNRDYYRHIEGRWAAFRGKTDALFFSSGYQLNVSLIRSLIDDPREVIVFADRLVHASILDGILLSGADFRRYRHNELSDLERQLKKYRAKYREAWIISETLFSMEGDFADIDGLIGLARDYESRLYIDEAHSTGIWEIPSLDKCDILIGTFGKAYGLWGAYVCVDNGQYIERIINRCRGFIFSTAPPPMLFMAVEAVMDLYENDMDFKESIDSYKRKVQDFNERMFPGRQGDKASQIIPFILGEDKTTLDVASMLRQRGLFVPAIRPPTVPEGTSRLRISLSLDNIAAWEELLETLLTVE